MWCIHPRAHTHAHIWNGILVSHKKEWNNAICSNMDGHRNYHTKWSKPEETNVIWYHLYVKSKKKPKTYKQTYSQNRDS